VIVGLAGGSFMAPMSATVTQGFDEHRALAVSLVSAGLAVAPMTVSPFASWLIAAQGWRAAQLIIGVAAAALLIPASLLVRRPPSAAAGAAAGDVAGGTPDATAIQALKSPQFAVLVHLLRMLRGAFGPIFHT
jgi:predicted MFS family arabinose efflux permease